jgi:hypothetical protein
VERTKEELREIFRLAYRKTLTSSDSIAIVMLVAAKQDAMVAGVTIREIQNIEYEERQAIAMITDAVPTVPAPEKPCPKCARPHPANWQVPIPSINAAQTDLIKRGIICEACNRDKDGHLRPTMADIRQSLKWKK